MVVVCCRIMNPCKITVVMTGELFLVDGCHGKFAPCAQSRAIVEEDLGSGISL